MTPKFCGSWVVVLVLLVSVSACSGNASSRQADVDQAVRATLTAIAAGGASSRPASTPQSKSTPVPAPTETSAPISLADAPIHNAGLTHTDLSLGGDFSPDSWVDCPPTWSTPTGWLQESANANGVINQWGGAFVYGGQCSSYDALKVEEHIFVTPSERQAARLSQRLVQEATRLDGVPDTLTTEYGPVVVVRVPTLDSSLSFVVAQADQAVIMLAITGNQTLTAQDYEELARAAVGRLRTLQRGH